MMEWLVLGKWLVVLGVFAVVGAPLSAWLFPRLPRRGAAFSLPVTLVGLATVVFLVGQLTFGVHSVALGVLVVAGASAIAYRQGASPDWRAVAGAYAVFAAGFLLLAFFRGASPGITPRGGEQFLHFGLVKTLTRTEALPPEDFWYAGRELRYYYGTQLQVTSLSMLTDTPLRYGFNLGVATFYGVLVVSAYGLAGAVTSAAGRSYRLGGILGVFFVALGGALTTTVRLIFGLLPTETALTYGRAVFGFAAERSGSTYPEMYQSMSNVDSWFWWYTRYVVPDTLQEFPMYSFVKSDLHGHTLSTGYIVLAGALAFSYYRLDADQRGRRLAVLFGGLGVVAGVFGFMNTWSLPTAVGLTWLTVAAADAHPTTLLPDRVGNRLRGPDPTLSGLHRLVAEVWRVALAVVPAVVVGAIGYAIASPFLVFGYVPENEGVGLFPPRTALAEFLVVYGALLALFAGFVWYRGWPGARETGRRLQLGIAAVGVVAIGALLTVLSFPVLAITGPILLGAWWLVRTDRAGFEGVLLVAGVGLILSLELVFAKVAPWPEGPARWNTSLKVAVQGWTLAGAAAGGVAALLLTDAWDALASIRARVGTRAAAVTDGCGDRRHTGRQILTAFLAGVLVVAVVLASAPFPVLAGYNEMGPVLADDSDFSLDGLETHDRWRGAQMDAIYWLDDRDGRPVVLEAPGQRYQWSSPVATLTGLPTLVGWAHHQRNYRPDEWVGYRVNATTVVYDENWRWTDAASVLRRHTVEYVYVGEVENETYGENLRNFDEQPGLSTAFENNVVTIYRVNHSALPGGTWVDPEP
jgi:YYY domain-containing protein